MFNIAIDGPSSSGKSTIAQQLATKLGFVHIDSGSMYRAVALKCLEANLDLNNEKICYDYVKNMDIKLLTDGSILIDNDDVTYRIRNNTVADGASKISTYASIRNLLVQKQQALAKNKGFVMDGRDITSVVLPDAEIKIYQTADVAVRAKRRYDELVLSNPKISYDDVYEELVQRDERDMNRQESPLIKVADAVEIDTTYLTIAEVVTLIMEIIESRNLT